MTPSPTATATATASPTATPTETAAPLPTPVPPPPSCASLTGAVSTSAPGGTLVGYNFNNAVTPGSTNALSDMPVSRSGGTAPPSGPLYAYSQDFTAAAGRYLAPAATPSTTASSRAGDTGCPLPPRSKEPGR